MVKSAPHVCAPTVLSRAKSEEHLVLVRSMWFFQVIYLSKCSPKNVKVFTISIFSELRELSGSLFLVKKMALDLAVEKQKPQSFVHFQDYVKSFGCFQSIYSSRSQYTI